MKHLQAWRLFFLGFLTLFLELVLIRYLAGNIWNLGYFPNLVLIAVFVGMGCGFVFHETWREDQSPRVFVGSGWCLLLLILFVIFLHPIVPGFSNWQGDMGGDLYFSATKTKTTWMTPLTFLFWFAGIIVIFLFLSQRTAKLFRHFSPLGAYTLDILGSLAGILTFFLFSWFQVAAPYWFVLLLPLYGAGLGPNLRKELPGLLLPLLICVGLVFYQDAHGENQGVDIRWSPYQKIERHNGLLLANGITHQEMVSLHAAPTLFYHQPYLERARLSHLPPYEQVLVLGAGTGNDVAAALMHGATRVDAVEIDPVILDLGRAHHPDNPYADPRVHMRVTDGRVFMNQSQGQYDLIIFALTDSLVKVSAVAQLRLENYLFTREAITQAFSLLHPDGDLLFYNFYRKPWIEEKIKMLVFEATGFFPVSILKQNDFTIMLAGKNHQRLPRVGKGTIQAPRDDWPFLYLKHRTIPLPYALAMFLIGGLAFSLLMLVGRSQTIPLRTQLGFLFMGSAFLLLETKSVVQFSLLFGTTWKNTSYVFFAILFLVLVGNAVAHLVRNVHCGWIFAGLFVSSLLIFLLPLQNLLTVEREWARWLFASLITFSPIFFANWMFSHLFRDQRLSAHLFGWNLIGATLGGALEYTSMWIGYRALAILVIVFYLMAFLLTRMESGLTADIGTETSVK